MRLIIRGHSRSGTTVTRNILSALNGIMLTNEFRMYDSLSSYQTAQSYFKTLSVKCKSGRTMQQLGKRDPKLFVKECIRILGDPLCPDKRLWVHAVEDNLFSNSLRIIGDKTDLRYANKQNLPYFIDNCKHIFIYRDGRDCVASGFRHFKNGMSRSSWATNNITEMSNLWVRSFRHMDSLKEILPSDTYLTMRFEDYKHNPAKVANQIAEFLSIKPHNVLRRIHSHFETTQSHTGYFKTIIPNWQNQFSEKALETLTSLGYING